MVLADSSDHVEPEIARNEVTERVIDDAPTLGEQLSLEFQQRRAALHVEPAPELCVGRFRGQFSARVGQRWPGTFQEQVQHPRADEVLLDWYSGTPPYTVTPLAGIRNKVGNSVEVKYAKDNTDGAALNVEVATQTIASTRIGLQRWHAEPVDEDVIAVHLDEAERVERDAGAEGLRAFLLDAALRGGVERRPAAV